MEKKDYFEKENEFLTMLYERESKLYSKNRIFATLNITPEVLKEKNYILEYCDLANYDNGFLYYDAIFQNKSGLYVYLSRRSITEKSYQIMIYFDPEKLEETKFFIKNLLKLKNGN